MIIQTGLHRKARINDVGRFAVKKVCGERCSVARKYKHRLRYRKPQRKACEQVV